MALALLGVYLLVGPVLAVPDIAPAGFIPSPEALRALLSGLIDAWRDSLTLLTPLGSVGNVLIVPWVTGLVSGMLAGSILWRSRVPGVVALVFLFSFLVAAAFGSRVTETPLVRGVALTLGLLVWHRWRSTREAKVNWPRRLGLTAVVVTVAAGLAVGVTAATAGPSREVLRDHVEPPFDPLDFPSPLSRFRAYYAANGLAESTLFTTTGLAPGDRIRIATMDTFDGVVWNVAGGPTAPTQSGSFERFVPQTVPTGDDLTITIADYSGPWVPTVGATEEVHVTRDGKPDEAAQAGVVYNEVTGTMAQLNGVQQGSTYSFRAERPIAPSSPETLRAASGLAASPPGDILALTKRVQQWLATAGGPSDGALAQVLTEQFRQGYYSDGKEGEAPSSAGHGVKRLVDLVTPEQMVGNDEQYASAMGVAGQSRGLPIRVVMGFVLDSPDGTIRGRDVHAWVEVNLQGAGWVAFAPTPDKDRTPKQQRSDPEPEPQPNVLQPPLVPEEPDANDERAPQGSGKKSDDDPFADLGVLLTYAAYGAGAVVITSPVWLLLLGKRMRRRRRRTAPNPVVRVSGGWKEIADRARDLGTPLRSNHTRYESESILREKYPKSNLLGLALVADRHVFGPSTPTDEEAAAYWADVDEALKRLRQAAPWWRRPLAVLSPASLPWKQVLDRWFARTRSIGASAWTSEPVQATVGKAARLVQSHTRRK